MPGRTRQRRSYICAGKSLGIFDRRQTSRETAQLPLPEARAREFGAARRSYCIRGGTDDPHTQPSWCWIQDWKGSRASTELVRD
jgi:hypothetical protein